jgi:ABC-type amino acid transport substrate-binding protein
MKKTATILSILLLLTGCGGYRSLGSVRSSGTLRVLVRGNPANPYAFYDGGAASGLEIELIEEFASGLEVKTEYAPIGAEDMETAIASGEADMAVGMLAPAPGESPAEGYTLPHCREKLVFVCPVSAMLSAAEDLNGKTVGLVEAQGGEGLGELGSLSGAVSFEIVQDAEDAARQLAQGRVDAVMCLYGGAAEILAGNSGLKCVELDGASPVSFRAYVNRRNKGLLKAYNEFIAQKQLEEIAEDTEA